MDNIYIDTRYGFSWTKEPNEVLKGHLKQLLKGSKRTYIEVHRDLLAEIAELLDATPAAAAEPSDTPYNLGWAAGWDAHIRATPVAAAEPSGYRWRLPVEVSNAERK